MAGLLTFVSARGDASAHREAVADALQRIHHRGSGAEPEIIVKSSVVFGAVGQQPLSYPVDGRYLIVFDGAIYNAAELRAELIEERAASFATGSDAEVIAAAYHHWGPSAVNRLRGMFAFVIWDGAARRAFGARDQFGIVPLYLLSGPDGVYFASEKKALLPFAGEVLDAGNLQHYLTLQYVPEPGTMHKGVSRLGAGESFVYTPGGPVANRRYGELMLHPSATDDETAAAERIRQALRDSVQAHLRPDRPVGALLSPGFDSAAVVALAREFEPGLRTYTVGYDVEGHPGAGAAQRTAEALGVTCHETTVGPDDLVRALPAIMWHLDDPIADPAVLPLWFAAEAAGRDVGVVLTGHGADELFGGYPIYREPLSLAAVSHLPDPMQRGLRAVSRVIPQGVKGKSFLERGTTPIEERYYGNARVYTEDDKAHLLRRYDPQLRHTVVTAPVFAEAAALDDVATMQYLDLYTWLRGNVLAGADRMVSAHSLQLRAPMLDRAVFEVAAALPTELKVPHRGPETKAVLRHAFADIVPPEPRTARRLRAPVPIRAWLRLELYDWAHDVLSRSGADELLDLDLVRGMLQAHRKKDDDHSRKIWTVLMYCLWHGVFVTGALAPAQPVPEWQTHP